MLASSPKPEPSPNAPGCASYERARWCPVLNENLAYLIAFFPELTQPRLWCQAFQLPPHICQQGSSCSAPLPSHQISTCRWRRPRLCKVSFVPDVNRFFFGL